MAWRTAGLFWFGPASLEPALVRKTQQNRIERSRLETCDLAERIAVVPGARRLEQECENAEGLRRRVWQPRHDILYICCLGDASPSRGDQTVSDLTLIRRALRPIVAQYPVLKVAATSREVRARVSSRVRTRRPL